MEALDWIGRMWITPTTTDSKSECIDIVHCALCIVTGDINNAQMDDVACCAAFLATVWSGEALVRSVVKHSKCHQTKKKAKNKKQSVFCTILMHISWSSCFFRQLQQKKLNFRTVLTAEKKNFEQRTRIGTIMAVQKW